ncbi:hypothetical protein WUBG_15887 [Wuchereria bancrofti]|uniref:Uncharacterized protein n=1 Tax=Wuchereria bancrofti TaxID=6293 RepID=J9DU71_WUCBA|nr:hypothetical protein WUBG_15887 [Wuchereria bancrofti]
MSKEIHILNQTTNHLTDKRTERLISKVLEVEIVRSKCYDEIKLKKDATTCHTSERLGYPRIINNVAQNNKHYLNRSTKPLVSNREIIITSPTHYANPTFSLKLS